MNKEQIIDEAYENYKTKTEIMMGHGFHGILLTQEEFIDRCKTNPEFSERWGLKIDKSDEKLLLSDVSCSYIDLIGDVALIKREKDRKWAERNGLK